MPPTYVPVLKQLQDADTKNYYFSGNNDDGRTPIKFRNPKYLSMLNHLRFYLPEVYPALKKVVFLDDDVVVQKDLSPLFSIDLNGNVNGAVETCMETFHRFHKYLNYSHPLIMSHFDPDACGWAFGMNVFDLVASRKRNVTGIYHYWQGEDPPNPIHDFVTSLMFPIIHTNSASKGICLGSCSIHIWYQYINCWNDRFVGLLKADCILSQPSEGFHLGIELGAADPN